MKRIFSTLIIITLYLATGCEEQRKGLFLERGVAFFDQEKYKESELEIKSAIQENPSLSQPYYYMALLNEKGKKYKAMKANLLEAVKLDPENTKAKLKLSKVLLLFNDIDGALKEIESILTKYPAQLDALAIKASIFLRQKKDDEALVIIDGILNKDAEHIDALSLKVVLLIKQKAYEPALALLTAATQKHSDNISLHLLKIQIDSLKNDADAIIADYEKLAELKPDSVQIQFTLAKVYQQANQPEKAKNILNTLIEENPELINLNIALLDLIYVSDEDKAMSKFDIFIEKHQDNYEKIIILSQWLISKNKTNKAESTLISATKNNNITDKDKVFLTMLLARTAFQNNNPTKSLTYLDSILNKNAEDNNAKILKSEIQISLNNFSEAKKLLEEVLWQKPNMDSALSLLGRVNEIEGDLNKAILNYENALKNNPKNLLALNFIVNKEISEGHSDYAVEILERALRLYPSNLKILTQLVELNFNKHNFDTADKYINKIQLQKRGVLLAEYLKANAYQRQNKCNEAITAYQSLLVKAPWLKDALTGMAECYLKLNQKTKMMVYLDKQIKDNPNNIFAVILKSKLLSSDKQYNKAIALITQSLELEQTKNTAFHTELGKLYNLIGDNESERNIYREGLKISPNNIGLMLSLASNLEKKQAFDQAIKLYENILSINPQHNVSKNNLATLLLDHYGKTEDINKATKVIASFKQTKHPYFLDTFGWAQLKSGKIEDALSTFKKVIILEPNVPVFRYHLAVAYTLLGDEMSASSELKQALYIAKGREFTEKVLIEELLAKLKRK